MTHETETSLSRDAEVFRHTAARIRREARGVPARAAEAEREAAIYEGAAAGLAVPRQTPVLSAGEVIRTESPEHPPYELRNTLADPDQVAIDASVARTGLLLEQPCDLVALAIDTAESLRAAAGPEKMLAHQLAVLHVLAMKAAKRALELDKPLPLGASESSRSVDFARQCGTVTRLAAAFQEGLVAMQTVRRGARQTVRVEHVTVEAGAQAVIGAVSTRARVKPRQTRGGRRK